MPERTNYPAGSPSWADLSTPDVGATAAFYNGLFGWDLLDLGPDAGGYGMFTKDGKKLAGVGPRQSPEQPLVWSVYVNVDDIDKALEVVQGNGGTALSPSLDVMTAGRMAIVADPTGAAVGLWQPGDHHGAELFDEPNTFCWVELSTRDTAAASDFYGTLFGWDARTSDMGGLAYTEFTLGGESVAGMMESPADAPADMPAHWMPYFIVESVDDTAARANELGATLAMPPTDVPGLRFAVIADPHGSHFGVFTPERPAE